jgi:hypothetical protein
MSLSTCQGTKRALIIGIDAYPLLPKAPPLKGCVNDALSMRTLLETRFGFAPDAITTVLNEAATRIGILNAMLNFAEACNAGDEAVLHFSGHGSQAPVERRDKPRGYYETLLPTDSGRDGHPNRDIPDYEISAWLRLLKKKGVNVTLIFDSCHSGSIARDSAFGGAVRRVAPHFEPIALAPFFADEATRDAGETTGPSGWLPRGDDYTLLAACAADEYAYEIATWDAPPSGAFTHYLCEALRSAPLGATYRDIWESLRFKVNLRYPRQHPQLEGRRDREIFGAYEAAPMPFAPVESCHSDEVVLQAGAAHGVAVGARWTIYPPHAKRPDPDLQVALTEICAVEAVRSRAKIIERFGGHAIAGGHRAVESRPAPSRLRMRVAVAPVPPSHADRAARLRHEISASPLLLLVEDATAADVQAEFAYDETDAPVWRTVGLDGRPKIPSCPIQAPDAAVRLRCNLEKIRRYENALNLENPTGALTGAVDLILLRQTPDGDWTEALPDETGEIVFTEGDRIAFRIINRWRAPVYVSALDFGLTKEIGLLYPPAPGANESLAPSRSVAAGTVTTGTGLEFGVSSHEAMELYFPDDFPLTPEAHGAASERGRETFMLLATTEPADFSWVTQRGPRRDGGAHSPLESLLAAAVTGERTERDVKTGAQSSTSEWMTQKRTFTLKRKAAKP